MSMRRPCFTSTTSLLPRRCFILIYSIHNNNGVWFLAIRLLRHDGVMMLRLFEMAELRALIMVACAEDQNWWLLRIFWIFGSLTPNVSRGQLQAVLAVFDWMITVRPKVDKVGERLHVFLRGARLIYYSPPQFGSTSSSKMIIIIDLECNDKTDHLDQMSRERSSRQELHKL